MLIHEITLHNFAGYKGRQSIHLSPPSQQMPVVLFGGLNGAGKTSLLDAMQLVLYGKRARCSGRAGLPYEEYLRRCVNRSVPSDEGAGVTMRFETHFDGALSQFTVSRTWCATGRSLKENVSVSRDGQHSSLLTTRWDEVVEELMPLDIASLFFFDGEKIEALADPERAGRVISTAIDSLLGLSLLQRLQTDLVALERRKRSETSDTTQREALGRLDTSAERALATQQAATQEKAACLNRLERAQSAHQKADERFRRRGGDLYDRRRELEERLAGIRDHRSHLVQQLKEIAAGSLPLALVEPLLDQVIDQLHLEHAADAATAVATEIERRDTSMLQQIGDMLPREVRDQLDAFIESDRRERSALAEVQRYLNMPVEVDRRLAHVRPSELERSKTQSRQMMERLDALNAEIEELERLLASVPADDVVAAMKSSCEEAYKSLVEAQHRYDLATEELLDVTRSAERAQAERERAYRMHAETLERIEDADRTIVHSIRVRDTVDAFRRSLIEKHLHRIEAAVLDSLRRLMRKQRLVEDLRLDTDTFELQLFDRTGQQMSTDRLSAGERQILAVALLWGLARVSGRALPTVIDTPLGRLDSTHRQLIAERYFPNASHQVILLSTDEEIDDRLLKQLQPAVGRSYLLEYDDETSSTSVREGYFSHLAEVSHVA